MFVRPVPSVTEELLTCQIRLVDTLLFEAFDDFRLGGDGCVVRAGHPAGVFAIKSCAANQNILYRLVQHVTHVQHACHIWWGYHNRISLSAIRLAVEQTFVQPVLVPAALHLMWVVGRALFRFVGRHLLFLCMSAFCLFHCVCRFCVSLYGCGCFCHPSDGWTTRSPQKYLHLTTPATVCRKFIIPRNIQHSTENSLTCRIKKFLTIFLCASYFCPYFATVLGRCSV